MSRFREALEALSLGEAPKYSGLVDVAGRIEHLNNDYTPQEAWRFSVRFAATTVLPKKTSPETMEEVRRDIVRQIHQYAFGEFLEPLMILRKRAYEVGDLKMVDGVNEIIDKMFKE